MYHSEIFIFKWVQNPESDGMLMSSKNAQTPSVCVGQPKVWRLVRRISTTVVHWSENSHQCWHDTNTDVQLRATQNLWALAQDYSSAQYWFPWETCTVESMGSLNGQRNVKNAGLEVACTTLPAEVRTSHHKVQCDTTYESHIQPFNAAII